MEKIVKYENIEKSKFEFVQTDTKIFDAVPVTKPVGYFKDAWRRFKKNKASVAGAVIILFLLLFSLIMPLFANFPLEFYEPLYGNMPPKNIFSSGIKEEALGIQTYEQRLAIGVGANDFHLVGKPAGTPVSTIEQGFNSPYAPIKKLGEPRLTPIGITEYVVDTDVYKAVGFIYYNPLGGQYEAMKTWQEEHNLPILYPVLDSTSGTADTNPNIWYQTDEAGRAKYDSQGKFIPNYHIKDGNYTDITPSGEVRVLAENWFIFMHGTKPGFTLGTDGSGRDIIIRLALGIRTSMLLAISIVATCFVIGSVIGAMQGYYGGTFDMVTERIMEILVGIPFFVIIILVRQNYILTGIISPIFGLFLVFIATGWIGDAGLLRAQFYRFKHHEYVLAARTLGAKDSRIMFKHIFPNTLGTIITSIALSIPSFIFGETQLSYLGIIKLDTQTTASIGGMISAGQKVMYNNPNVILWPALVISLLMISFNLFGNGLRDAFNPQLRGVEE